VTEALGSSGLTVAFGGVRALDDVSVSFGPGEVCGLIGPNGAGKTTLFDCLSGVRPPTGGSVRLGGVDVTGRSATWRARHGVRRTFQRQQVFGALSVEDNVLVACEWRRGHDPAERRQAVVEVLARCGLADVRHVAACHLPIGTARMVELARALVDDPTVLMLDEPTSGLGPREAERLATVVDEARTALGCAVVLVEHDVDFVMGLADRVVVLDRGRVIGDGSPAEVRADPAVQAVYLGGSAA